MQNKTNTHTHLAVTGCRPPVSTLFSLSISLSVNDTASSAFMHETLTNPHFQKQQKDHWVIRCQLKSVRMQTIMSYTSSAIIRTCYSLLVRKNCLIYVQPTMIVLY